MALAEESFARFAELLAELRAEDPKPVACAEGCSHCCYPGDLRVSEEEAMAVAAAIATWSAEEQAEGRMRLEAAARAAEELDPMERWRARLPCPLLDVPAGVCTVYAARPLACRGWNSFDAKACEQRGAVVGSDLRQHEIARELRSDLGAPQPFAAAVLRALTT